MMIFRRSALSKLIEKCAADGYRFIAPVRRDGKTFYEIVDNADKVIFDFVVTDNSAKEHFLSRCEPILEYRRDNNGRITVEDSLEAEEITAKAVLFGSRPCDAAALPIIEHVFRWDYDDHFVLGKLASTVVITIACIECNETCFCTSVGCAPDAKEGSDIMLYPTADPDVFAAEFLTDKGEAFVEEFNLAFEDGNIEKSDEIDKVTEKITKRFDAAKVNAWLTKSFNSDFWKGAALACISCGICSFTCPTCHCFDIIDEGNVSQGIRFKNWDGCQFKQFTLHTSGHNPRPDAASRYRQRIMHKFNYYPRKFGPILCTGCGRCIFNCPVGIDMEDILERAEAEADKKDTGNA